ncbi:MAG TPA: hypothetical protein VE732_07315, partial [Nitrososphaera sp.]|nr:hypothetical protein [Nitrososphaera sp.]
TTAYTVVSFYQWRAMEKSLRVSQRAYVAVHSLQPDWKTGQIAVVIENIGKVPAEDVKIIDVDTYREVEDKVYRSERQVFGYGHNKLFPGNFKTQIVVPLQGFTQQDTDMISAGKERIIIVGTIQYGDGFSNTDTTPLGYRYFPPPADRWEEIPTSTKAEIEAENERRKNQK